MDGLGGGQITLACRLMVEAAGSSLSKTSSQIATSTATTFNGQWPDRFQSLFL